MGKKKEETEEEVQLEELEKKQRGKPTKQMSAQEEKILLKQRLEQLELEENYNKFIKDAPKRIDDLEKGVNENRKLLIKLHETQKAQQEALNVLTRIK